MSSHSFTYDPNGNMLHGLAGKVITYDYANRPDSVLRGGVLTEFAYGADGSRRVKSVDGVDTFYFGIAEIRNYGLANETILLQPHPDFRITDIRGRLLPPAGIRCFLFLRAQLNLQIPDILQPVTQRVPAHR